MLSAIRAASSSSWVTKTVVRRRERCSRRRSSVSSRRSGASRPVKGSSSSKSRGRTRRARASATRRCCPPESSAGKRASRPVSPSAGRSSAMRAAASAAVDPARPADGLGVVGLRGPAHSLRLGCLCGLGRSPQATDAPLLVSRLPAPASRAGPMLQASDPPFMSAPDQAFQARTRLAGALSCRPPHRWPGPRRRPAGCRPGPRCWRHP